MFSKIVLDGYIAAVTTGNGTKQITESEYNTILSLIHNRPIAPDGFTYKLKADTLTWELVELPEPSSEDDEATEEEIKKLFDRYGVEY